MSKIKDLRAREILDSRGNPTVEVDVILESGIIGRMMVPSGASTGQFEALELRDGGSRHRGKGVTKAVKNANTIIRSALIGQDIEDQARLDNLMIALDGTPEKSNLGANAILGASFACIHAAANEAGLPLFRHLAEKYLPAAQALSIPVPMVNIISGGLHAGKNIDLQDFLIIPVSPTSYPEALEMIYNVYWKTREVLIKKGHNAYLLARSEDHTNLMLQVNEEIHFSVRGYYGGGTENPQVRADMIYYKTPNGGALFAPGSLSWCGSLSHNRYDNNVSRIMENVINGFLKKGDLP
jgi:enolase